MPAANAARPFVSWLGAATVALVLYMVSRDTNLYQVTSRETEGLNTLILLIGSIYAVVFAFVIFVIWGQFTEVQTLAARECSSLRDLLRFSRFLDADAEHAIRRAVVEYSRSVYAGEWAALGNSQKDPEAERAFAKVMKAVLEATPANESQRQVHHRLLDMLRDAGQSRDERVEKSLTRIPSTLERLVRSIALTLVLLVFIYPFHHPVVGASCFLLLGTLLYFADLVMRDTDNPFDGLCNVSAQVFADLAG